MGDVAMLVPVVASLAKCYPNLRITVLSQPFASSFFDGLAPNVGFMAANVKKDYKGVHGLNALYRRLIAKHFTAVADMHDVLRTKYLRMRFNMDRYKVAHINKHHKEKRQLTKKENKKLVQLPTSFDNYAEVLNKLGYPITYQFDSIFSKPIDDKNISSYNEKFEEVKKIVGDKEEPWIGIAPFAAHKGKIYPLDKMEEVISIINSKYNKVRIYLFGGGKEKEVLDNWVNKYPCCVNASKLLNGLSQELILMSYLDAMVSMDSANMHLASMVGTPVVSIWGATHPYAGFMGWNQKEEYCIQKPLDCRPCSIYGNKDCYRGDYACLNNISAEDVINKIIQFIN